MRAARFLEQQSVRRLAAAVVLMLSTSFGGNIASGQNVAGFLIAKSQNFRQTSSAAPVADAAAPFQFVSVVFRGAAMLTGGSLTFTGTASPRTYSLDPSGSLSILDTFATQAQMDAAYGNGNYTVNMNTTAGNYSRSITLLGFLGYPTLPQLTVPANNWQAGSLLVDVTQDYTFTWNSFANATAVDFIQLAIAGSTVVVQLPASQTSYTVPAGTLLSNVNYSGTLGFVRVAGATTGGTDVGNGVAVLVRTNTFSITTVPEPSVWALAGAVLFYGVRRRLWKFGPAVKVRLR